MLRPMHANQRSSLTFSVDLPSPNLSNNNNNNKIKTTGRKSKKDFCKRVVQVLSCCHVCCRHLIFLLVKKVKTEEAKFTLIILWSKYILFLYTIL